MSAMFDYFVKPVSDLTGKQDNLEQFAERLTAKYGDLSQDRLERACEHVLARWKQKRFPTYKALTDALDASASNTANSQSNDIGSDERTWSANAIAYCETRKGCYMAKPFSEQWLAWLEYHESKGHKGWARGYATTPKEHGRWENGEFIIERHNSAPTEWPWNYDRAYQPNTPRTRDDLYPAKPLFLSAEKRSEILSKLGLRGSSHAPHSTTA